MFDEVGGAIMNRKLQLLILILAFCLAGTVIAGENLTSKESSSESAKKPPPKKVSKTKKPKAQKFVGNITAIDTKTGAMSVKGTAGEKNFTAQDIDKEALERLVAGDRVRISYAEKNGKLVASSVRRLKLAKSKTKPTPQISKSKTEDLQKETKEKVK
jgi:hypothetical protein